jgi:hypothetical protein
LERIGNHNILCSEENFCCFVRVLLVVFVIVANESSSANNFFNKDGKCGRGQSLPRPLKISSNCYEINFLRVPKKDTYSPVLSRKKQTKNSKTTLSFKRTKSASGSFPEK